MARSAVARATCAAGARPDRLSRESVICSPSLNARSGSFCRLDIGHLTTRHVTSMADLVPNDPLDTYRCGCSPNRDLALHRTTYSLNCRIINGLHLPTV